MTQEEKLKKIIERAVENGWVDTLSPNLSLDWYFEDDGYSGIIFNHLFAKAYFGEQISCGMYYSYIDDNGRKNYQELKEWQYYIQQLALTPPEERIDYLFDFIENE